MVFNFKNKQLIRDGVNVPMQRDGNNHPKPVLNRAEIKQVIQRTADPISTREAHEIIFKILDSKY